jgi:hypothetical protein
MLPTKQTICAAGPNPIHRLQLSDQVVDPSPGRRDVHTPLLHKLLQVRMQALRLCKEFVCTIDELGLSQRVVFDREVSKLMA